MTTESPDEQEAIDGSVPVSRPISALLRFAIPVALLLLSANYVRETWGTIRAENLYYPYLIIGLMSLLIVIVLIEEVIELQSIGGNRNTMETIRDYVHEWRLSICLAVLLVSFAVLIPRIGFFSASIVFMGGSMYAAGVRDYKVAAVVVAGTLALIWIMFVVIVGVAPPTGAIDGLVLGHLVVG